MGLPGRSTSQVEKITTFKLGHPVFEGGIRWCMFPLVFMSEVREFLSAPSLAEKKNLMTARVTLLSKWRASPDMLPFSLCNKKRRLIRHKNRPLFPTTRSIPSYDIGKYVGLMTYQHPLVHDITEDERPQEERLTPRLFLYGVLD